MSLQKEGKISFTLDGMYDLTCKLIAIRYPWEKSLNLTGMHAIKLIGCSSVNEQRRVMHLEMQKSIAKPNYQSYNTS